MTTKYSKGDEMAKYKEIDDVLAILDDAIGIARKLYDAANDKEKCETCMFYDSHCELALKGKCRRNAPVVVGKHEYKHEAVAEYPVAYPDGWCGDYKRKDLANDRA
jgi:hypothetical protein